MSAVSDMNDAPTSDTQKKQTKRKTSATLRAGGVITFLIHGGHQAIFSRVVCCKLLIVYAVFFRTTCFGRLSKHSR